MHVALIDTLDKTFGNMPNPAITSLAGYLIERGYDVEIFDLFYSDKESQDRFFQKQWDLIGITATSFAFPVCREVAAAVKRVNPDVPIVVGGPHASVARESVLEEKEIDFAIYGEGEVSLLELMEALEENPRSAASRLREIQGLIFRDGENPIVNPPRKRIRDIDSLPLPPYDIFPMHKYDIYPLVTSRGCPFACVYCASQAILGRIWVAKAPQKVVEEVEYLIANWGKRVFTIVDDSFNLKEDRVKEFCQLLLDKKLGIQWSACGIRADKTDPEMLRLMKESGCHGVSVGIESANPQVLKNIGKGETIKQIAEGIDRIKKAGINVCGMFMIGNPADTLETVKESIEFAKSQALDRTMFYLAVPFPGTGLWEFAQQQGKFLREDYENFHDFTEEPMFETEDFTYRERVQAYQAAKEVMFPRKPVLSSWANTVTRAVNFFLRSAREEGFLAAVKRVAGRLASHFHSRELASKEPIEDGRIGTRYSRQ